MYGLSLLAAGKKLAQSHNEKLVEVEGVFL